MFKFRDENGKLIRHNIVEKPEQDLAKQYIKEDDIVLELGARYGSVSCVINSIIQDKNNQVSVEPDCRVWNALENNMKRNNCNFNIIKGFISKKKLSLTNLQTGYGATSIENEKSDLMSYTLEEVEQMFNLKFNVLIADCEGFLGHFLEENPKLYEELRMIIFEADYVEKCNYNIIKENLRKHKFNKILEGHQNVWIKN